MYDYELLLQDDRIEDVYIALTNMMHTIWTRRALLTGKHLLCVKPLTMDIGEA